MKGFTASEGIPVPRAWSLRLWSIAVALSLLMVTFPLPAQAAMTPLQFETCLLDLLNQSRASADLAPLEMAWDRNLQVRAWSKWMRFNTFRHMTSVERNAILPTGTWTWAENIAMTSNQTTTACNQIHDMFMNSEGHRRNRLSTSAKFVALGVHGDSSGSWVTELYFNAPNYPPAPDPASCPSGRICDSMGLQDSGGRFSLFRSLHIDSEKTSFYFGNPDDVAFSGDWNCDGTETLGLYRRSDGYVYLRNSNSQGNADMSFFFGNPGDVPIAGDFNNNGCDTVSLYRPSNQTFYIINQLGSSDAGLGAAEVSYVFGNPGDKPFVGDFNGNGIDTVGLHRESTGLVYYRNSHTQGVADGAFVFGNPGDMLVAGDWNGDGVDTVGVYRPSNGMAYFRYSNSAGNAQAQLFADVQSGMVAINP